MILRVISTVITSIAAIALLALMALTFADVVGREFLNKPLTFSVELTKLAMGLIVCLAFGTTTMAGRHISVDLVQSFVGKRVFGVLLRASSLLLMIFFGVLAWGLLGKARQFAGDGLATQVLFLHQHAFCGSDRGFIKFTVEVYSGELSFCYAGFDARIG